MNCLACGGQGAIGAKFCVGCGAALPSGCPRCGQTSPPGARFCMECGNPLQGSTQQPPKSEVRSTRPSERQVGIPRAPDPARAGGGERKNVTALFCDVAGSTALAERVGAEVFHELLSRFFSLAAEEIHRYEGSINKFLGDGFLALFGVPITHEHHARRAVLAALGIQRRLEESAPDLIAEYGVRIAARIGLNTGVVVVGTLGDTIEADFTAIGDVMNVAARLQTLGEPGDILAGGATARLVEGHARMMALGPIIVRGKTGPVAVHKILGVAARRSPSDGIEDRALSRFVGREAECSRILGLFSRIEQKNGQAVGIIAEPGMGKSRLLLEIRRRLFGVKVTYIQGACLSYGTTIPYLPILDILRYNSGVEDNDAPDVIADKIRFSLREVGLDPDECGPYLLNLLGLPEAAARLSALSAEAIRTRTFRVLRDLCLSGSRRRPLIFVVEDLHWIDTISEQFFSFLVESLVDHRILFVATYRLGYRPPWSDAPHSTEIALPPLRPEEGVEVVRSVLAEGETAERIRRAILTKAEGNPFFLEELAKTVDEHAAITAETPVPGTIQDVLMSRIDRLPDAAKRVLQIASVIGREVPLRLLSALWDAPDELGPPLAELLRREFLYIEEARADGAVYRFKHVLTQEVAYDSLLMARRRALHAAAGRAIEALHASRIEEAYEKLAYHYAKTSDAEKAVEYLRRSAERAARGHAYVEAAASLEEALAHAERLPDYKRDRGVVELMLRLPHWLWSLGRFADARDLLLRERDRVHRLADPALTGSYYAWLGLMANYLDERDRAAECAERAIAEASRCGDNVSLGRANYVLAAEGYVVGRFREGAARGREAAALLEGTDDRWWFGQCNWMAGINCVLLGEFDEALALFARSGAIGEALGDPRIQTYTMMFAALTHSSRGEWDLGVECGERAMKTAADPFTTVSSTAFLGNAYREKGDVDRALAYLSQAVERYTAFHVPRIESWFTAYLAETCLRRGDIEGARANVERALAVSRAVQFGYITGFCQRVLGQIAQATGALDEALAHYNASIETYAAIDARFEEGRTLLSLASLAGARGDRAAMAAHLRRAGALFASRRAARYVEVTSLRAREAAIDLQGDSQ